MGSALAALGGGGLLVLGIYDAESPTKAWSEPWFLIAFCICIVLATFGAYLLLALYLPGLPLPATRVERETRPDLRIESVEFTRKVLGHEEIVFSVGFFNHGRGDVERAVLNVVVPEFLGFLYPSNEYGTAQDTDTRNTKESLLTDDSGEPIPSIYWPTITSFPGRSARVFWFSCLMPEGGTFPVRVGVTAEALDAPVEGRFEVHVTEGTDYFGPR